MANHSQLKHWDGRLRMQETQAWIEQQAQNQSQRVSVKAYQRLFQFLHNISTCALTYSEEKEEEAIYESVYRQECSKLGISTHQDPRQIALPIPEAYYEHMNAVLQVGHSREELGLKEFIMELFTKNNHRTLITATDSMED